MVYIIALLKILAAITIMVAPILSGRLFRTIPKNQPPQKLDAKDAPTKNGNSSMSPFIKTVPRAGKAHRRAAACAFV